MYDAEILLPIAATDKYLRRLESFKRIGLLNVGRRKISLKLLGDKGEKPKDVTDGWPDGIEAEFISYETRHVASKVCEYYLNLTPDYHKRAKWFIRIDDDSITDVDGLLSALDQDYDCKLPVYAGTCLRPDLHWHEKHLLEQRGLFFPKSILHEVEANAISSLALKLILEDKNAMGYLKDRAAIQDGFCDQPLAIAARFAKIYASDCASMVPDPLFVQYSGFGGPFAHVHGIAPDLCPFIYEFVSQRVTNQKIESKFNNRTFLICIGEWETHGLVTFLPNGMCASPNVEFKAWIEKDGHLWVFDFSCKANICLHEESSGKVVGTRANRSANFILREVVR